MPKHGKFFALAYVGQTDKNATAAAKTLPGITTQKSAEVTGAMLLGNLKVRDEIKRLEEKLEERTLVTKERIIQRHAEIAQFSRLAAGHEGL